jgi:hypothetical protein
VKRISKLAAILLAVILTLSASTNGAFAQGTVAFANGPTTLISHFVPGAGNSALLEANNAGAYYFGLLTASSPNGPFTFTGIYATNTAGAGKLGPGTYNPAVPGWATGTPMFFEVAGWSSSLGTWESQWMINNLPAPAADSIWAGTPANTYFGLSGIASGSAGGGVAPAFPLFGGTGLSGFTLNPVGIPEPSSVVFVGLAVASSLIPRRRK